MAKYCTLNLTLDEVQLLIDSLAEEDATKARKLEAQLSAEMVRQDEGSDAERDARFAMLALEEMQKLEKSRRDVDPGRLWRYSVVRSYIKAL
jgi:hypothetical protein